MPSCAFSMSSFLLPPTHPSLVHLQFTFSAHAALPRCSFVVTQQAHLCHMKLHLWEINSPALTRNVLMRKHTSFRVNGGSICTRGNNSRHEPDTGYAVLAVMQMFQKFQDSGVSSYFQKQQTLKPLCTIPLDYIMPQPHFRKLQLEPPVLSFESRRLLVF